MRAELRPYLDGEAVADSIAASGGWLSDADIPDPLGWADVRARPDLVAASLSLRVESGWVFGHPRVMTYPKPAGGLRKMTRLDPIADLAYRRLTGRVTSPIEGTLSENVFNARTHPMRRSWACEPHGTAHRKYRDALRQMRGSQLAGEAHLDVRNHYGSVQLPTLGRCLNSIGASQLAVDDVVVALEGLNEVPGAAGGLPVGPEGSAPLGTLALVPLDRVLKEAGFEARRWADDLIVPIAQDEFASLIEISGRQLAFGGQVLNADKCVWVELGEDGSLTESLGGGGAMLVQEPLQALRLAAETGNPQGILSAIGLLRKHSDDLGVPILEAHPWIVERFPKHVTRYLKLVLRGVASWDWVTAIVSAETTSHNAGAQIHLARALPRKALTADAAAELFDHAVGLRRMDFAPVADQFFAVAGRSSERSGLRRRRALELADELAELNAKRSLLTAFRDGPADRMGRAGLRHLRTNQHELGMTVEWLQAA